MKKIILGLMVGMTMTTALPINAQEYCTYRVYKPYDATVFYDGYNETVFDAGLEDGILRHRNSLYAKKLTDENMDWFGLETKMRVTIGALCDNYDRIGNINIALVPKGVETYDPFEVQRIELARFITPFMNMNYTPDKVPYEYDAQFMSYIFHDLNLREKYDLWLEFELFGIPYAANEQVEGCEGRNDVFTGTLEFICTDEPAENTKDEILVPIRMKSPEYKGDNLNNYGTESTDTIGRTTKTYRFTVPEDVNDAKLVFITSNHGANADGEEYNRRLHLVYVDGELATTYTPGGKSCEPYRFYNTQSNGIYGTRRKRDAVWIKNSNWCPGDAIPIRYLELGQFSAGEHEIMIRVPEAEFVDNQGFIPVSMYFQGLKTGTLPSGIEDAVAEQTDIEVFQVGDVVKFKSASKVAEVSVYSYDGKFLYGTHTESGEVSLVGFEKGMYLVNFITEDGYIATYKAVKN